MKRYLSKQSKLGKYPLSARYLHRRLESGKCEFPPSMMISPTLHNYEWGGTFFKVGQKRLDKVIYGWAGFNKKHHSAGTFKKGA